MKDRLHYLIKSLGLTATRLADEIQVQRSGISHILSGRNQPSYDFITRLLTRYPEIDARWLLTGEGDVRISPKTKPAEPQKLQEPQLEDSLPLIQSEGQSEYKVTNVNKIDRVLLLHNDGTFEMYNNSSR